MGPIDKKINVYIEIGRKRIFASAIEWPGWSRGGRDEESGILSLLEYGQRYEKALQGSGLSFRLPGNVSAFSIVERLEGNATTDFGVPSLASSADARPVDEAELQRLKSILEACWRAFDAAVRAAIGKELRKGPRGGGRDLDEIARHVQEAEAGGYLGRLGWKLERDGEHPVRSLGQARQAVLDGLTAASHGQLPAQGPRGGTRWPPRYFVRRAAWHVLDHAWEIEDRID
jgi:hypothetical protein